MFWTILSWINWFFFRWQLNSKRGFKFKNVFYKNYNIKSNITYSKTSFKRVNKLIKNPLDIKRYDFINNLEDVEIIGKSYVNKDSIVTNSQIKSDIGTLETKLNITDLNKKNSYKGDISVHKFNVGKLFGVKKLGEVSLVLNITGKGFVWMSLTLI